MTRGSIVLCQKNVFATAFSSVWKSSVTFYRTLRLLHDRPFFFSMSNMRLGRGWSMDIRAHSSCAWGHKHGSFFFFWFWILDLDLDFGYGGLTTRVWGRQASTNVAWRRGLLKHRSFGNSLQIRVCTRWITWYCWTAFSVSYVLSLKGLLIRSTYQADHVASHNDRVTLQFSEPSTVINNIYMYLQLYDTRREDGCEIRIRRPIRRKSLANSLSFLSTYLVGS